MNTYHKIQTVFKRDLETNYKTLLEGEYSLPEFQYLKDNEWVFTEKVDGTNIRVMVKNSDNSGRAISFGGKTDNAQLPAPLVQRLRDLFKPDGVTDYPLLGLFDGEVCLYGEGYGGKIQKGSKYRQQQDFVLFDVRVGCFWLQREDAESVANSLGIDIVPIIGTGTLGDMVEMARAGIRSTWGDFEAEGIVARPTDELLTRRGDRVITKIKCRDFREG